MSWRAAVECCALPLTCCLIWWPCQGAILLTFVKRTPGSTSFDWRAKEVRLLPLRTWRVSPLQLLCRFALTSLSCVGPLFHKQMFALSPIEAANVTLRGIDQTVRRTCLRLSTWLSARPPITFSVCVALSVCRSLDSAGARR